MLLIRARVVTVAIASLTFLLTGGAARAADSPSGFIERPSDASDRERLNLTIYNGSSSLVHDRRRIALRRGTNRIAWRDVSAQIDATSAVLSDLTLPGGAAVAEQNYDYDLLDPSALLDKYVGRDVIVVHEHPAPGEPRRERARLLANNDGVVLQYADRVETSLVESHIVFPAIPQNLRDRPTLVLDVASAKTGAQTLDLAYMTTGLDWHAEYNGVVSRDRKHMDLSGLVTLTNTTGTSFAGAHVQLVAGNVHETRILEPPLGATSSFQPPAPAPAPVTQQNFFEYHLYTLGAPTTVANGQTKQVAFLHARNVPIARTLEVRGSSVYYSSAMSDLGTKLPVGAYVTFTNRGGDLGVPLPGGLVRLYENDAGDSSRYLAQDAIDHTPRDQDVRLHVGDSFDVTANKKQSDFRGIGNCTFESSYDVTVANAEDTAEDVLVVEPIPGTWSIVKENSPHVKTSSATVTWPLHVPAHGSTTLDYSARVQLCF